MSAKSRVFRASLLRATGCMVVGIPEPDTASFFGSIPPDRYSGGV
ncbi:hypothetical protein [Paraburkholderia phytofirmans]|nr:hypothetical protein [Paraburkholderia phytofirmans]